MNEADFLRAIVADPDDDSVRLAYCDWLKEQGEEGGALERAEFIRGQVELARDPRDSLPRRRLAFRVRELLDRHGEEWLGPLGEHVHDWHFHRGFLDKVGVPAATLEDQGPRLFAAAPLRRLWVTGLFGDLAPLCFVAGLTGPVLRPVLALRPVERLRFLTHPLVALPLWAVDLYVWHVPFLYEAALHNNAIHALEHLLFFTCGGLMWSPVLETLPAPAWFGTGWKLGYIAVVRMLETILGNVFIWSSSVFYSTYRHAPKWGISAVHDQNLAGVVMMVEGGFVTLAALAWLFLRLAEEGELRQRLIEEGYDPVQVKRAVRFGRAHAFAKGSAPDLRNS